MSEIVTKTARELRRLIGLKAISPVELLDACIERIERINPSVNAVVALDLNRARVTAREAEQAVVRGDRLGVLHGLPVLVKDLTATEGLVTTHGSLIFKDNVPTEDELIVARIREAGGIILGKTNTPEFGSGSNTLNRVYGACVNPFNPRLSCAGSSGGSAVALATDMVPLATGTDMGGSVRTPASFCGVVGHRCSPGLIPRPTRIHGWSTLGVDGPMARSVDDAALLLSATAGSDPRDPLSQSINQSLFGSLPHTDLSRLRVAFSEDLGCAPVSYAMRKTFREKVKKIAPMFADTQWRDPDLGPVHETFETLRGVEYLHAYGGYFDQQQELLGPNVIANVTSARKITVKQVGRAMAEQTALLRRMGKFFDDIDILICPATSTVPYPVEELNVSDIDGEEMATYITWVTIAYALTLTTHPVTVITCGMGPTNMPFGLQVMGSALSDVATIGAAAAIEEALRGDAELSRPIPDIDALVSGVVESKAGIIPTHLRSA
jgi:amidase